MRQPKFQFGDKVSTLLEMRSVENKIFMAQERFTGTVVGIDYDPANGTQGWPFYQYTIDIQGTPIRRPERLIQEQPND